MSFIEKLKQRKLVQWAVAYGAGAWVLLQVLGLMAENYEWSHGVMRVAFGVVVIGFLITMVLAWYHGERGEQRVSGMELSILTLLLIVGGGLLWRTAHAPQATHAIASIPAVTDRSIAVLPFLNLSGDPKNDYFSDGLAETTLDMLAQVPDLKVIARTSSFAFKGKPQDMRKIGAALGAASLLEGSVQKAGDTVRITVQLIKASDGSHLWSHHYDRPMVDVFKIQDEIATHVVQELAIALPASQQQHLTQKRTENVEAYQEYLKGFDLLPGRKVADMRVAAQHFERAIAIDPGYARAYVAASDTYNLLSQYATITTEEKNRAAAYVERALALAPNLGEAHTSRGGWLENFQHDLTGAEREYRRGIELAPSYATGYQWLGELLGYRFGRLEESLAMQQRAAALDPLSPIVQSELIRSTTDVGNFQEADRLLAKLHVDHPDFAQGYQAESLLAANQGDLVRALRAMHELVARDPAAVNRARDYCWYQLRFGALAAAMRCIDAQSKSAPNQPGILSDQLYYTVLSGDLPEAKQLFNRLPDPSPEDNALLAMALGHYAEILPPYRQRWPELFADSVGKLYPGQALDAILIGIAMLHTGAQSQGRALLQRSLETLAHHRQHVMDGSQWADVTILVALGEHDHAIAALQQGVADGYFLDLVPLDHDPTLVDFRKDPRYQQILAPARAKAAAQLEAARKAGLL